MPIAPDLHPNTSLPAMEDEELKKYSGYQCEMCLITSDTIVDFIEHIEKKHMDVVTNEVLLLLKSNFANYMEPIPTSCDTLPKKSSACSNSGQYQTIESMPNTQILEIMIDESVDRTKTTTFLWILWILHWKVQNHTIY